jgi:hypothetical protein
MMRKQAIASRQKLVIKAGQTEQQYWQDIWKYRELFYFLAWRLEMQRGFVLSVMTCILICPLNYESV